MLSIKKLKLPKAFTLVELLVFMVIIGIITGLSVGVGGAVRRRSKEVEARKMISDLEVAIGMYRADVGSYPLSSVGPDPMHSLYWHLINPVTGGYYATLPAGWHGPYMEFGSDDLYVEFMVGTVIIDPWSKPTDVRTYRYDSDPPIAHNANTFDLWSIGADGSNGTTDDIRNW